MSAPLDWEASRSIEAEFHALASDVAAARRQIWQLEADNRSLIAEIRDLRDLVAAMRAHGISPEARERTNALIRSLGIGGTS